MPNPSMRHGIPPSTSAERTPNPVNGILSYVDGQFISAGADQLPPAGPGEPETRDTVVQDVPDLGAVRIRYRLNSYRHGKSRHWHWLAVYAEKV